MAMDDMRVNKLREEDILELIELGRNNGTAKNSGTNV